LTTHISLKSALRCCEEGNLAEKRGATIRPPEMSSTEVADDATDDETMGCAPLRLTTKISIDPLVEWEKYACFRVSRAASMENVKNAGPSKCAKILKMPKCQNVKPTKTVNRTTNYVTPGRVSPLW
jgi:hypothetical protein